MQMLQTAKAVQVLKFRGEVSELELLKALHDANGSSVYVLANALGWGYGRAEQAVQRLLSKGLVRAVQKVENGRAQKLVFETPAAELIDFKRQELDIMEKYLQRVSAKNKE